ncbi:hypothetical protein [Campylobacter sp. 19-13652]|uniref:hypothetical protein n=1 Tax=Campylobacter sp. 19-13652 TaxID=2840180 RepID=UPI001C756FCA|nr:hypothetical protein [Campylobacter sp. 19-13652]BCX80187.1 hypothetical protein LBC_16490 [Campylobacter sp. 19-13652]
MADKFKNQVALVLAGVVLMSFEGVIIRLSGGDSFGFAVVFGLAFGLANLAILAVSRAGIRRSFGLSGMAGWLAGLAMGLSNLSFFTAVKLSGIALPTLVLAATPVSCAVISWLWLGKKTSLSVFVAAFFVAVGLAVIVGGGLGEVGVMGLVASLACLLFYSLLFVVWASFERVSSATTAVIGSGVLVVLGTIGLWYESEDLGLKVIAGRASLGEMGEKFSKNGWVFPLDGLSVGGYFIASKGVEALFAQMPDNLSVYVLSSASSDNTGEHSRLDKLNKCKMGIKSDFITFGYLKPWHSFDLANLCGLVAQANLPLARLNSVVISPSFSVLEHASDKDSKEWYLWLDGLKNITKTQHAFGISGLGLIIFMGLVLTPISRLLLRRGASGLAPAFVGLLLILESVFAPLFGWAILGEVPTFAIFIGGAIILSAVAINTLWLAKN